MEARKLGPLPVDVPVIGQGTWNMEADSRHEAIEALRRGIDVGLTHIDTAETYGRGEVEGLIAEAIAGRREEVFLVSKVLPNHAGYDGTLRACEGSLRRLRTDRLDAYLLHWPSEHPLEDTIEAFEELRRAGKIGAWGVSNFDVPELKDALRIAGPGKMACNQVLYHLEERTIEHAVLPWCQEHDVALVAYSPFGLGSFPGPRTRGGRVLAEVARSHGATPHAVALRFLVQRLSAFVIPKASKRAHVEANAAAGGFRLDGVELERLDEVFPRGPAGALPSL